MKLDKRIIDGKKPLTCFDIEEAKKYVGKDCYFSSKFENFENLSKVPHATLHNVDDCHTPFQCYGKDGVLCYDCFILPCEWVEQKNEITFEPYTLETFEKEFNIGDVVVFREKDDDSAEGKYYKCMYSGYIQKPENKLLILLGAWLFDFTDLFLLYEIYRNGTWEPFGRKANED